MSVIIKIENISKQYRLGVVGTGTLSHDLKRWWHLVRGLEDPYLKVGEINDRRTRGDSDYIWALKDISFEVSQGEVLGIIGRNGAGKSTLLKILSKVTAPTEGLITYKGRIASLLEVGTGFHPELTGRENIYLNGAILGMRKKEIGRKFDSIVDFSGCERYIDTPVKRYSSGMAVRLGFAVAAFLEPEILIVDEVLAVGDAEFQNKAIGKIHDVSQTEGRTVLFVSHNMGAIQNLCSRALILDLGKLITDSTPGDAVAMYLLKDEKNNFNYSELTGKKRKGLGDIIFKSVSVNVNSPDSPEPHLEIHLNIRNNTSTTQKNFRIDIGIDNSQNFRIAHLSNHTLNRQLSILPETETELIYAVKNLPFAPGRYSLTLYCESNGNVQDWLNNTCYFNIENADFYKTGKCPPEGQGNILLDYNIYQT